MVSVDKIENKCYNVSNSKIYFMEEIIMSMKKFFIALLAMILCFSMLLTACGDTAKKGKDKDKEKETETGSSDEKQLIIDKIAEFNLKEIVDTVLSGLESGNMGNMGDMMNTVFEALDATNAEANIDITYNGETGNMYAGFKDNVFQAVMAAPNGETEGVYATIKDGNAFVFMPYNGGAFEVNGITDMMGLLSQAEMPDIKEQLNAYLTDDIMNIIGEFKLPELKKEDLTKDGDFYYIATEYYEKLAEDVLNFVIDIMEAANMTEELPTGAELDAFKGMIAGVLEALNLKIGLAAGNDTICGFAISVDVDINALAEYFGGGAESEAAPMPAAASAEATEQKVKVEFKALATKDLSAPEYVTFNLDMAIEDFQITAAANLDVIVTDNELKGATMSLTASVDNVQMSYDDTYNESTDSYIATEIYGDIDIEFTGSIDISNIEKAGSEICSYDLSVKGTPKRYESYDTSTDEPYFNTVNIDNYKVSIESDGSVVVSSKGSANVSSTISALVEGESTNVSVSGNVNWLSAPGFKALPSELTNVTSSGFAKNYESALEKADELRINLYNPNTYEDDWVSYLYYDNSTGLYIIIDGERVGETRVFINRPPQYSYDHEYSGH